MDARPSDQNWIAWQLADSAFPSGGFAHSLGIEALQAHGLINDDRDLFTASRTILRQQTRACLPMLRATHLQANRFVEIDLFCDAVTTNHIARQASCAQGRAFLRAASEAFSSPAIERLEDRTRTGCSPGHLPPVFGVVGHSLNLTLHETAELFTFLTLRGLMSAAVRLGLTGPLQAQSVISRLIPDARSACDRGLALELNDVAETSPILGLAQANQGRLYSRLFQS